MSEQSGTKQITDVLDLALFLTEALVREFEGDGFQLTDAVKLLASGDFLARVTEAAAGLSEVPSEVEDLSKAETIDLAIRALTGVRRIVSPLRAA